MQVSVIRLAQRLRSNVRRVDGVIWAAVWFRMAKLTTELLLSLPPNMQQHLAACEPDVAASAFSTCDPPGNQLGSGGGTAHVLAEAWAALGEGRSFGTWLTDSRKIIIHGGGQSRRLPAYAGASKLFVPVPAYRWSLGQRLDQSLLDLQRPFVEDVVSKAGSRARLAIASGDVLLRTEESLPALPDADVVLMGLWARPEDAQHFGVMFCDRGDPSRLCRFVQKPSPNHIRELAAEYTFMIDVGLWLLSERAVMCLMSKCGWLSDKQRFRGETSDAYDLYGEWGPSFGDEATCADADIRELTTAVVSIPGGQFYHFGKSRDIISSVYELQNLVVDQTRFGQPGTQPHPRQFIQNADFKFPLRHDDNHTLWVENSSVPASWSLGAEHILSGVPENDWALDLPSGVCLDFSPIGDKGYAIRPYGIDDAFRGALGDKQTQWMGSPVAAWFEKRGISLDAAGLDQDCDLQDAAIFPVVNESELSGDFVQWLCSPDPTDDATLRTLWLESVRVSATDIARDINLVRLYAARRGRMHESILAMAANYRRSVFYRLDLEHVAGILAEEGRGMHELPSLDSTDPVVMQMHDCMLRARVLQLTDDSAAAEVQEKRAFEVLRDAIVAPVMADSVTPRCSVVADQIVWGRAPARLDLGGGWTDTPPYCLERGGSVLNLAVDLNGQPPIQVFARVTEARELVIRSIDLGLSEHLRTYDEVGAYDRLSSGFAIARAALALAGFDPRFNGGRYDSLEAQLADFGGGIEISMLAAIPKGSGLGTSSILAATLLGTLADLADLGWDRTEIAHRTLALEQMLTSGGGWQDQVGGIFPGVKLTETRSGLDQTPLVRWAPSSFFNSSAVRGRVLLYYTGVTRLARNILADIVRGIFLNSRERLATLDGIGQAAHFVYDAIQRDDIDGVAEGVRRSWQLNQQLDSGTNVPDVQAILDTCGDDLAAAKLLGAGGGGYLFMIASSDESASRIRARLEKTPPNDRARFVDMTISDTGLHITRS